MEMWCSPDLTVRFQTAAACIDSNNVWKPDNPPLRLSDICSALA